MNKKTAEYIITAILVVIFVVLLINNLKPKRRRKTIPPKPAAVKVEPEVPLPVKKVPTFERKISSKVLSLQKKRAELDWGRDPFYPVSDREIHRAVNLVLKGISIGKDKKGYAFINDSIVTVGDVIEGFKVIEITKKKVLLEKGNEKFYLVLPEAVSYTHLTLPTTERV